MALESKTVQNFQGVYTTDQKLAQHKGAISRDSNLWFALRGALSTMPGSKILCSPGNGAPNAVWRSIQTFFPSIANTYRLLALSLSGSAANLYDVTGSTWNLPVLLAIMGSPMTKRPAILGGTPQPTPSLIPFADKLIITTSDSVPPYMYDGSQAPPAPTLGSNVAGALPATTYYVKVTYSGYASPSLESVISVPANSVLVVDSPPAPSLPIVATTYDVWVGTVSGQEYHQNTMPVNIGTNWTMPNTGLVTPPGATLGTGTPGGHQLLNNFNSGAKYGQWKANHNFKQNHIIEIVINNIPFEFSATQSGKSGSGDGSPGNPMPTSFPTTVNATIVDGDTGWKCLGPLPGPPPGAAYAFNHLGFLWLWGVGSSYLADGISGPDSIWQGGLNDPQYWDPAFTGFVGKGNGETAQGGAVLTLGETGIAATQQLVLFKDASTYSIFGDFSTSIEILSAKAGVGCIAPGTIQFIADLGIFRLSYKGMTLFDGQNDITDLYTDPIRDYIFGQVDPTTNEQLIPPLDFQNIQAARSTQVKKPSCYAMIAPVKAPTPPPPPTTPIGFVSSGPLTPTPAPPPSVGGMPSVGFTFTGNSGLSGVPVLPMTLTLPIPPTTAPGHHLVAIISVKGVFPGVGASMTPITGIPGWTLYTHQQGVSADVVNVLYRVVDGTEGPNVSFLYPGPISNFSGYQMNGTILDIQGADPTTPIEVSQFTGATTVTGNASATGVVTISQNDLLIVMMQPVNDGANNGGAGQITPGDPPGTVAQVKQQSGAGALTDTLAVWSKVFVGPGATGNIVSPSGWPNGQYDAFVIAISPNTAPFGEVQGFLENANGAITPDPTIKGSATQLISPLGMVTDRLGKLWIADSEANTNGAIISYANPGNEGGNTAPDVVISGPANTLLAQPFDVAVDSNEAIYVANHNTSSVGQILIYAPGASGDVLPSQIISSGLTHPRSVAVDANNNLYVLDDTVNKIYCWLAGNLGSPDRTISGAATLLSNPLQVRVSPAGKLWVTCGATISTPAYLLEFNLTDNGNVAPQKQITSAALQPAIGTGGPVGLAFDSNNDIFVAMAPQATVLAFLAADTGASVPSQTITGFSGVAGLAGFIMIPPLPTGIGATRIFVYDLEAQIWAIGDLPYPIGAAAFLPTLSGSESVIGHISDGTIRRVLNPSDIDFDGVPITGTVRLPEFGRSSQPLYLRRINLRAEGSGSITSVTAREKTLQGNYVVKNLIAPKKLTGAVDIKDKLLSLHIDLGFTGQVVIEGIEYQIGEKKPTRVG